MDEVCLSPNFAGTNGIAERKVSSTEGEERCQITQHFPLVFKISK